MIIYFLNVPKRWPFKLGTGLTQAEVTNFESARFVLEDGFGTVQRKPLVGGEIPGTQGVPRLDLDPLKVPFSSFLEVPPSTYGSMNKQEGFLKY